MERVAFLVEPTGERVGCLLNPESLLVRRTAGVEPRRLTSGPAALGSSQDDPLLFTGGGKTELELHLLFDVMLASGSSVKSVDVRDHTAPLWRLAENTHGGDSFFTPPLVRFVWGKSWNTAGVVLAVSERLERFTVEGVPQRSWMTLLLRRVDAPVATAVDSDDASLADAADAAVDAIAEDPEAVDLALDQESATTHLVLGGDSDEAGSGERLDTIAERYYGNAALWRVLAMINGIDDPLRIPAGTVLVIPSLAQILGGGSGGGRSGP